MTTLAAALLAGALTGPPASLALTGVPSPVPDGVDLQEHLGAAVPRDVALTDHRGRATTLASLLDGERPLVLVLAYYRCPMLCGLTLNGLARAVQGLDGALHDEYRVATVSFDPRDGPADAERARVTALDTAELPTDGEAWPFLTAEPGEVERLADALGFQFAYDERTDQYGHPAVVFVITPDGTISRYLHGFSPQPLDLRLAVVEAGRGEVGNLVERTLVTCYRYDPTTRRYGFHVLGFIRIVGGLLLLTLGTGLFVLVRRDLRRSRAHDRPGPTDHQGRSP